MHKTLFTAALIVLSLSACGSAHIVRKDATGGHIALHGPYMLSMGDARVLMAEHCHGRYEAVEHSESPDYRCVRAKREAAPLQVAEAAAPQIGASTANGL